MMSTGVHTSSITDLCKLRRNSVRDMLRAGLDSKNADLHIAVLSQLMVNPDKKLINHFFYLIKLDHFSVAADVSVIRCLQECACLEAEHIDVNQRRHWHDQACKHIFKYLNHSSIRVQIEAVRALRPFYYWEKQQRLLDLWEANPETLLADEIKSCLRLWIKRLHIKSLCIPTTKDLLFELDDDVRRWRQLLHGAQLPLNTWLAGRKRQLHGKQHQVNKQMIKPRKRPIKRQISATKKIQNKGDYLLYGDLRFHRRKREIEIDAWVAMNEGAIEHVLVPQHAMNNNALFATAIKSVDLQSVFLLIGAGRHYHIDVQWENGSGKLERQSIASFIRQGDCLIQDTFTFIGSRFVCDIQSGKEYFAAAQHGVIASLTKNPNAILGSSHGREGNYRIAPMLPFKQGTLVELILRKAK